MKSVTKSGDGGKLVAVELRNGQPMVSSLTIAEIFQRRHDRVIARVREINLPVFWDVYRDAKGEDRPMFYAAEREALIMMPYLGGRKSIDGQTRLVDAYLAYHHAAEKKQATWQGAREDAILSFTGMSATLADVRTSQGKPTRPYHFSSEARLINFALTGQFGRLSRGTLSAVDLKLLAELQRVNAMRIAQDQPYAARKAALIERAGRGRLLGAA